MLKTAQIRAIYQPCRPPVLTLFERRFSNRSLLIFQPRRCDRVPELRSLPIRSLSSSTIRFDKTAPTASSNGTTPSQYRLETIVREARQTFGDSLPRDLLSAEEYAIYERLYGPPLEITEPDDADYVQEFDGLDSGDIRDVLLREVRDGQLEEVRYDRENAQEAASANEEPDEDVDDANARDSIDVEGRGERSMDADYQLRQDIENTVESRTNIVDDALNEQREDGIESQLNARSESDTIRSHPLTVAGRFGTSPDTLQLPKGSFTDAVTDLLSNSSNTHLLEMAQRIFDGPGLPSSPATPLSKRSLPQKPIKIEASQPKMGGLTADVYLAAVMPGTYAAVMSSLVEVRKRLGKKWLTDLMEREGGPRMLDAGAGGAGVVAWKEIIKAEWQVMNNMDGVADDSSAFGKTTVVTGSDTLRHRASRFLNNTTFLPRLPDYVHLDSSEDAGDDYSKTQRKQYDVIVAPHTLWPLQEGHHRKHHVQNLWSLLNPNGGVLILIEKGVPRGFEAIAGAREMLLDNYITPDSVGFATKSSTTTDSLYTDKEQGMIIAPCTNHKRCPMYIKSGERKGRKDFCYFSQRYIRPPYLQRIIGAKDRNHEDIRFSYVAVRRGNDEQFHGLQQGEQTTSSTFRGESETAEDFFMLGLPRSILPPMKRQGHVILDLCTSAGRLERWTVPKSFGKQAYRDARKSDWGDLWALGAKTRIDRKPRDGRDEATTGKGKNIFEVDLGDGGTAGIRQMHGKKVKQEKRNKKGRKMSRVKPITEDDFEQ
ncbi:MAG: 37S ribosomal protein S22 [Sclerophora amabilis]|nr:MAG: 37S ribosomal protein S22 [Sclerophora amabilis]